MTEKKLLRQQIKDAVSRLSPQEKAETSVIIEKRIESLPLFAEARTILLFYSLPDEVNTHEWIAHWNGKKRILLPVVKGETLIIRPYSPGEMKPGSFGIAEPTGEDITDLSIIDMVIVPGVGFDPKGNRLGRGKGFYDRLLKKLDAPFIGVAYDCQIAECIPALPHDVSMSLIISKSNIYWQRHTTRKTVSRSINTK